jgi:NADH-quinone oxidoreductase subunit I
MSAISKIIRPVADLWSLVVGLQVTGRNFCRKQVTVHYPRQVIAPEVNASYRGPIKLVPNPRNPLKAKCTACMICVGACPSQCITVVKAPAPVITAEQEKAFQEAEARGEEVQRPAAPREAIIWINDFSLCSLCGLCVESCPTKCIEFSHDLYTVRTNRADFQHDLLVPFPENLRPTPADGAAPAAASTAEEK